MLFERQGYTLKLSAQCKADYALLWKATLSCDGESIIESEHSDARVAIRRALSCLRREYTTETLLILLEHNQVNLDGFSAKVHP